MPCLPSLRETPPEETRRGPRRNEGLRSPSGFDPRSQYRNPRKRTPQRMKYSTTHPPRRVCGNTSSPSLRESHPKKANETHGEIRTCAATQGSIRGPVPKRPRRIIYGTTHPLRRVCGNTWSPLDVQNPATRTQPRPKTNHGPAQPPATRQPRSHASHGPNTRTAPFPSAKPHPKPAQTKPRQNTDVFSPTTKPHPPKEYIDKAQGDIRARAQPRKNSMLDYPQYNDATPAKAGVAILGTSTVRYPARRGLSLMHETPPDKNTAKVQDQKWTCAATCNPIQEPNTRTQQQGKYGTTHPPQRVCGNTCPQTPATGETTGKAPGPLQKIMPETGWVTV
ncbi:hypothetical protein BS47DRAFT_1367018 [Hydnum rufescens UP504]|uniref:Uncharacterized protein n=1 Tax=Hydnum rufescens UP504 TaxID=1448309 RepID=A0A9P6DMH4_9AGAM|nr:hypothetical protein BS47DRAFT_1367018 [Hydnum rufescens UP504]